MSGWGLVGLAAIAFGPATANVEPRSSQISVADPAPQLAAAQAVTSSAATAQYRPTGFEAYKIWLVGRARQAGIRETTIRYIPGLQLKPRVMELDRAQQPRASTSRSFAPFAPYRREHVSSVADHSRAKPLLRALAAAFPDPDTLRSRSRRADGDLRP